MLKGGTAVVEGPFNIPFYYLTLFFNETLRSIREMRRLISIKLFTINN